MRTLTVTALTGLLLGSITLAKEGENWPTWRGPLGTGEAQSTNPPIEWGEDQNIKWKIELPGAGKGSPVIWGDLVFIMCTRAIGDPIEVEPEPEPEQDRGRRGRRGGRGRGMRGRQPNQEQEFLVIAYDRNDGSVVWEEVATEGLPHEGTHRDGSWASASCVTDGELIYAHFGSRGLFAFDMDGSIMWDAQFGEMRTRNGFGEGSTPAVHDDTIVVVWDHEEDSFIVALDKRSGDERWRRDRDEVTSWATPFIVEVDGKPQVIVNGTTAIRGYDLESGEVIWTCSGMTTNAIPSPVYADGKTYVMSGFRGSALVAIELSGAKGDITDSEKVLWTHGKDTPYVPSPLLYQDTLYFLKVNGGVVSAFDVRSGEALYGPVRMETISNIYASPVAAAGRVYFVGREGEIEVLEHGPEYKVLATNKLEDRFDSSPAIVGDQIYLRGDRYLYCIAAQQDV